MVNHGLTLREAIYFCGPQETAGYSKLARRGIRRWQRGFPSCTASAICRSSAKRARIFFRVPELVAYLADHFPLIYTVRDPRAILRSIVSQDDSSAELKAERWEALSSELPGLEAVSQ